MKRIGAIFFLLFAAVAARAQFFSSGNDPGGVKWRSVTSEHFRLIYPAGNDSLALRYGLALEKYLEPVGGSIGYEPNALYRRPMPVILHSYTAKANGSVVWAPRRMDLFTRPQSLAPEPLEWITELAVHESRHVAQMQFARDRGSGVFRALTGELFTGAMAALYPGPALLEGDAVAAETGLTPAGRGRAADFLEYYRVSFADGDYRDWYRWRWGSQKLYTPDHYRAGYLLVAGTRSLYDDPLFTKRYYENIVEPWWPFPFFVLQRTLRQASGKGLKGTWAEIAAGQQALWAADEAARGPFGTPAQITRQGRLFTEYYSPEAAGDALYAIRQGLASATQLVRVLPDGKTSTVRYFSPNTSALRYSDSLGRLFWSEITPDPRWSLKSDSQIFYLEPGSRKARRLTVDGSLSNPAPAPSGTEVAVTEYPVRGGSAVRVIDGTDGRILRRYTAPDGLQVVETAWLGQPSSEAKQSRLIASAISAGGFAFYDVVDGFRPLTDPLPVKIKQLRSADNGVLFVSDANGVNELYRLGSDGSVERLTNNRFGASDFLPSGDSLVFAALTPWGRMLYREALSSPFATDKGSWPIADKLSAQENSIPVSPVILSEAKDLFSSPRPYRKLPHLLRLHSWAPAFIDYDAVSSFSFETLSSTAGLGATAFFQNDLGTASAIAGYSARRGVVDDEPQWDHSFHGKFTYSGLFPVIELSADIGGSHARRYLCNSVLHGDRKTLSLAGKDTDTPSFRTKASVYIPWDFSRAGWYRGLVPRLDVTYSNDLVNTYEIYHKLVNVIGDNPGIFRVSAGVGPGRSVPLLRATGALRGYVVLGRARSAIYPRWGLGAEAGFGMRPGSTEMFAPSAYAYMYGYVPGLMDTHGTKITATYQTRFDGRFPDGIVNILPRGMSGVSGLQSFLLTRYISQTKLTLDYAMPLLPLDWSGLGPVAYVRNFELTLHADGCFLLKPSDLQGYTSGKVLYSAGANLAVRLGNLLWIPYATRIGVSYNYNGGALVAELIDRDYKIPTHRFGLVFTVDIP
jgi:hypothetical protein